MLCRFPHLAFHTTVRDLGVTLDSALTRSSYFQLRRLRTIRKAVYVPVFTSTVHAFVCSRIDYCNSFLIGLPKTRLSPLQTVLNAAARLIARLPRYSHISSYINEHLHWLPISTRIENKVLLIVLKAQMEVAPKSKSSQVKYRLLHGRLERIGEASADTAATETYYMKGYYNLEEETIKVKI